MNNFQASSAAVGEEAVSSSSGPRTLAGFFINLKQMALNKAARFYVYGTSHVSKAAFECPYFREVQVLFHLFDHIESGSLQPKWRASLKRSAVRIRMVCVFSCYFCVVRI